MPELYGTLLIPNKTGKSQLEYPIEKLSVLIGRDKSCDIRIVNKEVSRRHLELSVNGDGEVSVVSLGREPVMVNREQVLSPRVLQTGDKIEVLLEGRTREFFFKANAKKEKSLGSPPLVASSIVNRRSYGGQGVVEAVRAEVVTVEADKTGGPQLQAAKAIASEPDRPSEPHPDVQPDTISVAVSQMVQEILERVVKSVSVATSVLTPVHSSIKRKSVRFVPRDETPEGHARDVTMTIRCRPKDEGQQQAVLIEDDTMAISEWGFKSMQNDDVMGDAIGADNPSISEPMVTDAHVDHDLDNEAADEELQQQPTPASIGERVSLHDALNRLASPQVSNKLNFEAFPSAAISQGTPGVVRAPATTPVTAAKSFIPCEKKGEQVDFAALAQKLEEIAEEHDVQFELPKDFMRFTPVQSVSKSKRKSLCETVSCRSVGRTSKRLSICSSKDDSIEYDLPKDFMRFTPMVKSALKNVEQTMTAIGGIHESPDDDAEEIATLRSVGHAVHDLADALDKVASAKKSIRSKTPGVKITIVEKASTGKSGNPEVKVLFGAEQAQDKASELSEEMGGGEHGAVVFCDQNPADPTEVKGGETDARTMNAKKMDDPLNSNNIENVVFNTASGSELTGHVKAALAQARAYRTQALILGKHLKKSSAKLAKAHATSQVLSIRYRAEKAKRIELQNMIKRLIEGKEAEEAETEDVQDVADDRGLGFANDQDRITIDSQRRVVVLGQSASTNATQIEMAGNVVVVRPIATHNDASQQTPAVDPVSAKRSRRSSKTLGRSVLKSVTRVSLGGERVRVMVDDIEVPNWIFNQEEDHDLPDNIDSMKKVQVDTDAKEEQEALASLEDALRTPLPDIAIADEKAQEADEDDPGADACFVCGIGDDGDVLLLCDSCDNACHLGCCKPARKTVPKGDWFCTECKAKSKKRKATSTDKALKGRKENVPVKQTLAKKPKAISDEPSGQDAAPTRTRRSTRKMM